MSDCFEIDIEVVVPTQSKSKEIRQRSRRIIHHMELACLEDGIPIGSIPTKGFGDSITEYYQAIGIV